MRRILGTVVLGVALLAPTQVALARNPTGEQHEMTYQVIERMTSAEMKMGEVMMKLMKARSKMSSAKMQRIMNMLDAIDKEIQKLIEIGDE